MIVCKVCGHTNEEGAGFCGNCGSFLEWSGERVDQPPDGGGKDVGGADVPVGDDTLAGGQLDARTEAQSPPPDAVICPNCGFANAPDRTFCARCATELLPVTTIGGPPPPPPPVGRSGPPLALIGGAIAVVLVAVVVGVLVFPRGAADESPDVGTLVPSEPVSSLPGTSESPGVASQPPSGGPPNESTPPPAGSDLEGLVVFAVEEGGDSDLWTWDPATDSLRQLVTGGRYQDDPSWSPDRALVVYRDPRGLRMATADGEPADPPDFTHHGQDRHPAWSPDGELIAFASDRPGTDKLDIFARPVDGGKGVLLPIVSGPGTDWDPAWSPDGQRIAFVSRRDGTQRLYSVNRDGSREARIRLGGGIYDDPAFSPDGKWLAFTRRDDADSPKALHVARPDGTEMRRLTSVDDNENDMTWSPDGRYIAVVRGTQVSRIVVIEAATGQEVTSFGIEGAANRQPDWR